MARVVVLLAIVVAVVAAVGLLRRARQQWVEKARLAGRWCADADGVRQVLDLHGGPAKGNYLETVTSSSGVDRTERGDWWLEGRSLCLRSDDGGIDRCAMVLFADGSLGLSGSRRGALRYRRDDGNVVPMRRP